MGLWNSHGMVEDPEDQMLACDMLALLPEELMALSDHCSFQSEMFREIGKRYKGQEKRKHTLVANHFQKRARRFKELAALVEHEQNPDSEEFEIELDR